MAHSVRNQYYLNSYFPVSTEPAPPHSPQTGVSTRSLQAVTEENEPEDLESFPSVLSGDPAFEFGFDEEDLQIEEESDPLNEGEDRYVTQDITREQILTLYRVLEAKVDGGPDDRQLLGYLDTLKEALRDERDGREDESSQAFQSVNSILNGDSALASSTGDPLADGVDQTDPYADPLVDDEDDLAENQPPTRVDENGVKYYEAEEGKQDFDLAATGDASVTVVETDGSVIINPKNQVKDEISISETTRYTVVKINHEGKVETLKISKRANLTILSENVRGNAENEFEKLRVGSDGNQNFVNEAKREEIGAKLKNADNFGRYWTWEEFREMDDDIGHYNWNKAKYESELSDVKEALNLLSSNLQESNPDRKQDLETELLAVLNRWKTQYGNQPNELGNYPDLYSRLTTLFDTLYGEVGEIPFKNALQSGLIPISISRKISELLSIWRPTAQGFRNHYAGSGSQWNPASMAEFLSSNSGFTVQPINTPGTNGSDDSTASSDQGDSGTEVPSATEPE